MDKNAEVKKYIQSKKKRCFSETTYFINFEVGTVKNIPLSLLIINALISNYPKSKN